MQTKAYAKTIHNLSNDKLETIFQTNKKETCKPKPIPKLYTIFQTKVNYLSNDNLGSTILRLTTSTDTLKPAARNSVVKKNTFVSAMAQTWKASRPLIMKNRASGQSLAWHAKLKKVYSNETRRFSKDCESQAKHRNQLKPKTWQTI